MEVGHDYRPLRVRTRNVLIDRWRVTLPGDAAYLKHLDQAIARFDRDGSAVPYAGTRQTLAEIRRRALINRLCPLWYREDYVRAEAAWHALVHHLLRLWAPVARSRSLKAVRGWGGGVALIVTSWWLDRWSALLANDRYALILSVAYILLLYVLLRAARRNGTVVVLGAWLFVCCIAVACVVSYDATPAVVSGREAGHWLRTELPPHASRLAVMAFIARHWNQDQTVTFGRT